MNTIENDLEFCKDCIHKAVCRLPINIKKECKYKISMYDRNALDKMIEQLIKENN